MTYAFTDGKTPEEAGRDDARAAMVEPRRMLRAAAKGCDHDPVLDGPSGIHVCSKCGRGINVAKSEGSHIVANPTFLFHRNTKSANT